MLGGVEEYDLIAAVLDRLGLSQQAGRIIAATFGRAGAALGRARVSIAQPHRDGLRAALEIRADRAGDQNEETFVGGADAEKGLGREHEGAQIEAAFPARNPGPVDLYEFLDCLQEHGLGHLWHGHARG